MTDNIEDEATSTSTEFVETSPLQNAFKIFRNIVNKLSNKKALVIIVLILIVVAVVFVLGRQKLSSKISNTGEINLDLDESEYSKDKGIRIFLKADITDEGGDIIAKELLKYQGVSGYSLIPVSLQHQYEKYNNLYPKSLEELSPGNQVIIDLYVSDSDVIKSIVDNLKTNPNIQAISNLSI